jgi:hypothetical protein
LRHWLCSTLLSAHLYESELLSLYLGFRLCSLPDSIMSDAVGARVCQVAYICGYLGVTSMLLSIPPRVTPHAG